MTSGRVALLTQDVHTALARFDESLAVAKRQGDDLGETIALHHRGWAELLLGEFDTARDCFEQALVLSARLHHDEGVAYALEGLTAVAAAAGDPARAGTLLGAAQVVRERTGLYNAPSFSFHQQFVDGILASPAAGTFEAARARDATSTSTTPSPSPCSGTARMPRHPHPDPAAAPGDIRDRGSRA